MLRVVKEWKRGSAAGGSRRQQWVCGLIGLLPGLLVLVVVVVGPFLFLVVIVLVVVAGFLVLSGGLVGHGVLCEIHRQRLSRTDADNQGFIHVFAVFFPLGPDVVGVNSR